ncbi:hypothetical protein [Stenotrophomonas maltophilia]|uniref:hypothetical protein n=1 Tax=Stenotrophomonas maltophilia TaxID=40324 RepID=UPI0020908D92|nr:hypothetical protein [Stenotrophomonas maltophilia]MCO5735931.1 hypothetical protein [Stenotrophomonas maltophilia]
MCSITKKKLAKITHPGLNKVIGDKNVEKLADPGGLFPNDPAAQETPEDKPIQYLSNFWLDGTGTSRGVIGRNNLRMDLTGQSQRIPVVASQYDTSQEPSTLPPTSNLPSANPPVGGGGGYRNVRAALLAI